jgi:hypothetical protein
VQNELKKIQEGINSVTPTKPPKPQKDIECEKSPLETTEITPIKHHALKTPPPSKHLVKLNHYLKPHSNPANLSNSKVERHD